VTDRHDNWAQAEDASSRSLAQLLMAGDQGLLGMDESDQTYP
jgi:hypothetical protein